MDILESDLWVDEHLFRDSFVAIHNESMDQLDGWSQTPLVVMGDAGKTCGHCEVELALKPPLVD